MPALPRLGIRLRPLPRPVRPTPPAGAQPTYALRGKVKVGVEEPSDVTEIPGGRFLVVSDLSNKAGLIDPKGRTTLVPLEGISGKTASSLEAVAYFPHLKRLFVGAEEGNVLHRYTYDPDSGRPPRLEESRALPLGASRNKGIEGLAALPAQHSPLKRDGLLAVKEGKPRSLYLLDDQGAGALKKFKLEREVLEVCGDFSAVAVNPKTGHVFITSDETGMAAELKLTKGRSGLKGSLIRAFPLRDEKGKPLERVEGVTFNATGEMFILTENGRTLYRYAES